MTKEYFNLQSFNLDNDFIKDFFETFSKLNNRHEFREQIVQHLSEETKQFFREAFDETQEEKRPYKIGDTFSYYQDTYRLCFHPNIENAVIFIGQHSSAISNREKVVTFPAPLTCFSYDDLMRATDNLFSSFKLIEVESGQT